MSKLKLLYFMPVLLFLIALPANASWFEMDTGVTNDFSDMSFISAHFGYIAGTNGKIMKTENGGKTWLDVSPAGYSTTNWNAVDFVSEDTGFAVMFHQPDIQLRTGTRLILFLKILVLRLVMEKF